MNKTKRADIRISEESQEFIKDNDLSKAKIFNMGYEITRMCVLEESVTVTVTLDNGDTATYELRDRGLVCTQKS